MRAGKKKELLHEVNLGSSVYTTPVAKDGVLYINTRSKLFAIAEGAGKPPRTGRGRPGADARLRKTRHPSHRRTAVAGVARRWRV